MKGGPGLCRMRRLAGLRLRPTPALLLAFLLLCAGNAGAQGGLSADASDFPLIRLFAGRAPLFPAAPAVVPAVTEDGRTVTGVEMLERGAPLPLYVVLLVDTSGSMAGALDAVRYAAAEAVQRLGDADTLALIGFADQARVLAPPSRDRQGLGEAIAGLRAQGGTALYDAVKLGVQLARDADAPRRAVVLLTDGRDEGAPGQPGSATRLEPLRRLLAQSAIPVYTLALGRDADLAALQQIATVSGGRVYPALHPDALADLFAEVFRGLQATAGWRYISPDLRPNGTRRSVAVALPGGVLSATYAAPEAPDVLWRFTRDAEPGSLCAAAGLSAGGEWALIPSPLALVRRPGHLVTPLPEATAAIYFERTTVLDDGSGYAFSGGGGMAFAAPSGEGALMPRQAAPAGTPGMPVAASPSGRIMLWFHLPPGASQPTFTARQGPQAVTFWERRLCPLASCDRATGAAVADNGAALLNLTGVLQRVAADGTPGPARRETFFPRVALSADGTLGAAVVWRPGPKRALLLDSALRTVAELEVRSRLDGVPAVATVSPNGRWFAARDDFAVYLMEVATRHVRVIPLSRLRPGAACDLTLALDNRGHVLAGDGASVFLLKGAEAAP
jgi:hypothetical protein